MVHCRRSCLLFSVLTTGHLVLYSLISWPAELYFGSGLAKVVSVVLLSKSWALMSLLVRRKGEYYLAYAYNMELVILEMQRKNFSFSPFFWA